MPSLVITSFKINKDSITKKIDKALGRSPNVKQAAYKKAYGMFYYAKTRMMRDFDEHNITQELLAGPRATNISNTLGGEGNLFSFIGFNKGDVPTERLRFLLEMGTTLEQTVYGNKAWHFRYYTPSKSSIERATGMPWEQGNSWAYAVEKYISGLSFYLYKRAGLGAKSRSGTGLELPHEYLEDAVFEGKPYITEILNNFRRRMNTGAG